MFLRNNSSSFIPLLWLKNEPQSYEIAFAVYFVVTGSVGSLLNFAASLVAVSQLLRRGNALLLLIANFAIIDWVKATFSIYMGAVLISLYTSEHGDNRSAMRLLQISLLVLNFGNICSVFNVILASLNEYLYIRLPLHYQEYVTKCRTLGSVLFTWILAILLTLGKQIYRLPVAQVREIYAASNNTTIDMSFNLPKWKEKTLHFRELYDIVILACSLISLLFILGAYFKLYITIRSHEQKAPIRRYRSTRSSASKRPTAGKHFVPPAPKISLYSAYGSCQCSEKVKDHSTKRLNFWSNRQQQDSISLSTEHVTGSKLRSVPVLIKSSLNTTSQNISISSSPESVVPSHIDTKATYLQNRRRKCVVVILTVCIMHVSYLTLYFALQLHHMINVIYGLKFRKLESQFIFQFTLRALFVLQANLNPLAFLRIRSFREAAKNLGKSILHHRSSRMQRETTKQKSKNLILMSECGEPVDRLNADTAPV